MNIRQTGFHLWPERQKMTAPDCLPSHLFFYFSIFLCGLCALCGEYFSGFISAAGNAD
jgi:hypothetical protein